MDEQRINGICEQRNQIQEKLRNQVGNVICTMCGKPFDKWDVYLGDNQYDIFVNYPSKHDTERMQFNFCVSCFDKVLDTILPMCKINPIVDDDWLEHCVKNENGALYICKDMGPGGARYAKKDKK